jgi:hypothetical protein
MVRSCEREGVLIGYNRKTYVQLITTLAISCRSALVEIHRGLALYAKS